MRRSLLLGFIDALRNDTVAGRAGQTPAIIFMTTAEISNIGSKTVNLATSLGVGVFHGKRVLETGVSSARGGGLGKEPCYPVFLRSFEF